MTIYNNAIYLDSKVNKERFGKRLESLIEERGLSKIWLAEKLGLTKQALNYLIKHSSKPKYVDEISELLNISPLWLEKGEGSPFVKESKENYTKKIKVHNTQSILSYIKKEAINHDLEYIYYNNENDGNIIAYKIPNDSLFPPFMENSILLFDKIKKVSNGDYVLLFIKENESILVRQYSKDGNDIYYHPKNKSYKSLINADVLILGILIETRYTLD